MTASDQATAGARVESRRGRQKVPASLEAGTFFHVRRDSKDERYRATVRWTVVTASDQATAGARVESRRGRQKVPASLEAGTFFSCEEGFEGRAVQSNSPVDCCDRERPSARRRASRIPPGTPEKSTSEEVLFSTKSTLRVGEILLRNVKCA